MPVNSFEEYVLTWRPRKEALKGPLYTALAAQLERDISTGALTGGTKMPPQRELADYLDVSLNTITRAYTLCVKKGLLHAVTGKGTYVSEAANVSHSVVGRGSGDRATIPLDIAAPVCDHTGPVLELMRQVLSEPGSEVFFRYTNPLGTARQRRAGVAWLEQFGLGAAEDRLLIANGTQNGLNLVLMGLFGNGDKIAVDQYTYSNFIGLANMLRITLVPVRGDEEGMSPEELSRVLRTTAVKGIYLSPSCSNPQAICMPEGRRREIAQIIRRHGLILLEDDCYSFLREERLPPIATMAPEQTVYLNGLNKTIAPGLRIAYLWCPERFQGQLEGAVYNCNLITNPLNAEFAARMIESGLCWENVRRQQVQALRRSGVYRQFFPLGNPSSYYQWLPLPDGVSGRLFEALAAQEGLRVYGSERFLSGEPDRRSYLRISTTAARSEEELAEGLGKLRALLTELERGPGRQYTV